VILAGGLATRMGGGDKPLLEFSGRTLLEHVLDAVRPDALAVAISANGDPARYEKFGCPVLADAHAGQGPLSGVLAALLWGASIGADAVLTVPGDTPFIPLSLASRLAPAPACASSFGRLHPLVALWPVSAGSALAAWLERPGSRSVRAFADAIGARAETFEAEADPFVNVNTPDELAAARARAG
jgi:molybdopterin-guanine dinucleotide biosynthesis protein A